MLVVSKLRSLMGDGNMSCSVRLATLICLLGLLLTLSAAIKDGRGLRGYVAMQVNGDRRDEVASCC